VTSPAAAVLDALRASGVRITAPRRAVVTALVESADHVTADELAERVQAAEPDVHLSTVYRTLDALEKLGVVTHVHMGHGRAVYHLSESMHTHAVCEDCGMVVELPDDVLDAVRDRLRSETGFEVDPHHFALVGRCRHCVSTSRA
jgi:Fe2+ or Zn2+ uptake regulation protein